jgi:hypothetical protein
MEINQPKNVKQETTGRNLRSDVNCQGTLEQKGVQQTGVQIFAK